MCFSPVLNPTVCPVSSAHLQIREKLIFQVCSDFYFLGWNGTLHVETANRNLVANLSKLNVLLTWKRIPLSTGFNLKLSFICLFIISPLAYAYVFYAQWWKLEVAKNLCKYAFTHLIQCICR